MGLQFLPQVRVRSGKPAVRNLLEYQPFPCVKSLVIANFESRPNHVRLFHPGTP
jgi:hypothetical protein